MNYGTYNQLYDSWMRLIDYGLNYGEVLLLTKINNIFSNTGNPIYATDGWFSQYFYTSPRTVQRWISNLEKKNLIIKETVTAPNGNMQRSLSPNYSIIDKLTKTC